jgi:DNA polymerase III subunit alpha
VGLYISGHPLDAFRVEMDNFCNAQMSDLNDLEAKLNQEMRLAGIVTSLQHRTTKTGKPFGSLTVEDYSGSYQFMLFGEDYMKQKPYMQDGIFLYIRGRVVEPKWGNRGPEFKISTLELLHTIREKMSKSISLSLSVQQVNESLIQYLEEVLMAHKGECQVKVQLVDIEENITVELLSKRYRVNPENEFISKIKARPEVEIKIHQ